MFLCDLSMHQPTQDFIAQWRWPRRIVSFSLIIGGLYVASYPYEHPEWVGWSRSLGQLQHLLFPRDSHLPKRFTAVGIDMLVLGIHLSSSVKGFLSNKYCLWLGKNSFAVYLVHGTLLRTLLIWMIYGVRTLPESDLALGHYLPRAGKLTFAVALPFWFAVVYGVAHLWTVHVDSLCAAVTHRLEHYLCKEEDEKVFF
jgi:peptidoglycan/LPS O-acetylase OafA/YrhL